MSDTTHTIGSTGIVKKLVDLGDGTYADAVADVTPALSTELVLAAATGSTGGLGKLQAMAENEIVYVRCKTDPARDVEWRVKASKIHAVQLYKARTVVDSVTLTLSSLADTETLIINGITYTGEATANTATYDAFEFSVAGDNTADAAALAALINADYSVVTAGTSVAATDKLTITTDEGAHTIVAAAAADYPAGKYALNATAATELASIILAINHKDNVVCAAAVAGDTVTVGGITYTGKAGAENLTTHYFSIDTSNDATGTSLAACVNADTATHGISAVNATGTVTFTRASAAATVGLNSSNGTRLAHEHAGGVPGVIAAATPGTATKAELSITPTWTKVLTVTESGDRLTVTDIDNPGVLATAALAVVTLTPGTPAGVEGELATVIQAVSGTAAGNCVVSQAATLAGLVKHGAAVTSIALNSLTAGTIYSQESKGWEYCYCAVTNNSGDASTMALTVGATKG